jgi:putative drug exporter of the RND superfamily
MHLSGRANWWLPGWLDRTLPHLSIEPATEPAPAAALPGSARHASDRVPQPAGAAAHHLAASEQEPN